MTADRYEALAEALTRIANRAQDGPIDVPDPDHILAAARILRALPELITSGYSCCEDSDRDRQDRWEAAVAAVDGEAP